MENDNYGKMKESHKTGVEAGVSEASLQVRKSGKYGWSVFTVHAHFVCGGVIGSLADV